MLKTTISALNNWNAITIQKKGKIFLLDTSIVTRKLTVRQNIMVLATIYALKSMTATTNINQLITIITTVLVLQNVIITLILNITNYA